MACVSVKLVLSVLRLRTPLIHLPGIFLLFFAPYFSRHSSFLCAFPQPFYPGYPGEQLFIFFSLKNPAKCLRGKHKFGPARTVTYFIRSPASEGTVILLPGTTFSINTSVRRQRSNSGHSEHAQALLSKNKMAPNFWLVPVG